ncbi:MAG: hypothetical protein WEB02_05585 [Methylophaga sp.]
MNDKLTREDIELLMPFYVNGTLSDGEQQQVEAALETDQALQDDKDFLQRLQAEVKSMPDAANSPGEFGLKRLQNSLTVQKKVRNSTQKWRLAAIAASFLLVVQTTTMVMLTPGPDGYRQAGGEQTGQLLLVTFQPDATEAQIRELLLNQQLSIVEGPSALGIYTLSAGSDPVAVSSRLEQSDIIDSVQLNQ